MGNPHEALIGLGIICGISLLYYGCKKMIGKFYVEETPAKVGGSFVNIPDNLQSGYIVKASQYFNSSRIKDCINDGDTLLENCKKLQASNGTIVRPSGDDSTKIELICSSLEKALFHLESSNQYLQSIHHQISRQSDTNFRQNVYSYVYNPHNIVKMYQRSISNKVSNLKGEENVSIVENVLQEID